MDERETQLNAGRGRPGDAESEGRSSDDIRREIDRTRSQMDETVEALQQKLAPNQLVDKAWETVRDNSGDAARYAWDSLKSDPLPFALIGIGVAWLAVGGTSAVRSHLPAMPSMRSLTGRPSGGRSGSGRAQSGQPQGPRRQASGRSPSAPQGRVSAMASGAMDRVRDAATSARESVSGFTDAAREKASYASGMVTDTYEDHPVLLGAIALAVGLAAGLSIPISRREAEFMGETRDQLLEQARTRGQDMVEKGKKVAERALQAAKDEAPNLSPSNLAESSRNVIDRVTEEAKDEARKQNLTT